MRKVNIVVFFLLFTTSCFANSLDDELHQIESEWALAHYSYPKQKQSETYQQLLIRISELVKEHPTLAEPIILKAILVSTNAGLENSFSALSSVHHARDLLQTAIKLDPTALDGSAFVNLGTLYYKVPGWPIAFGDNETAEQLLLKALKHSPNGLDSNYFYGDFLLSQNKPNQAIFYLTKAAHATLRPKQYFADHKLQEQAIKTLTEVIRSRSSKSSSHILSKFPS